MRGPRPTRAAGAGCPHGRHGTVVLCAARPGLAWQWMRTLDNPPPSPTRVLPPQQAGENGADSAWTGDAQPTITPRPRPPGRDPTATRTMLNRVIVGMAEFSRRHALMVALGGLLLCVFSAFYASAHLGVTTDTDKMFSDRLPWRQQSDELNKDFPQFAN